MLSHRSTRIEPAAMYAKPLRELMQQWEAMRRERRSHRNPHAKSERNAEIVWMHSVGVPITHIARVHDVSVTRVRAILKDNS